MTGPRPPLSAEGAQFHAEVLRFLVVILVDAHLRALSAALDSPVGIGVLWGEDPDVNESSLRARGGLIGSVNVLGDEFGNGALEHLGYSSRCPGFPELGEAVRDP